MNITLRAGLAALLLACATLVAPFAAPASAQPSAQRSFATPDQGVDALTKALRDNDGKTVAAILGANWRDFVPGTRAEEDRQRANFLKSWDEQHKVVLNDKGDRAIVQIGKTGFVMPIPLVK